MRKTAKNKKSNSNNISIKKEIADIILITKKNKKKIQEINKTASNINAKLLDLNQKENNKQSKLSKETTKTIQTERNENYIIIKKYITIKNHRISNSFANWLFTGKEI